MAISFVGAAEFDASAGTPTSITANMPASIAVDDVMILAVTENKVPIVVTPPGDGWTLLDGPTEETALTQLIYWKRATVSGGGTAPTVTSDTGGGWRADVAVYRGVDPVAPFIDHGAQVEASSSTSHSAPALTNTDAGAWGVVSMAFRQVSTPASWTAGAGLTERIDADIGAANTTNIAQIWADTNGTQTTGSKTYTCTGSAASPQSTNWAGLLRPGSANLSGSLNRTGSGSLSLGATAMAAAGSLARTGTGALTLTPTLIGGQGGSLAQSGSGSLSLGGVPRPAGSLARTGSGTLTLGGAPAASGALAVTGSGSLQLAGLGFGALAVAGSGALVLAPSTFSARGTLAATGSGLLTLAAAAVAAGGVLARTGSGALLLSGLPRLVGSLTVTGSGLLVMTGFGYIFVPWSVWSGTEWVEIHPLVWDGTTWLEDIPVRALT